MKRQAKATTKATKDKQPPAKITSTPVNKLAIKGKGMSTSNQKQTQLKGESAYKRQNTNENQKLNSNHKPVQNFEKLITPTEPLPSKLNEKQKSFTEEIADRTIQISEEINQKIADL